MNRTMKRCILATVDTAFIILSSLFAYVFLIPYIAFPTRALALGTGLLLSLIHI